MVSKRPYVITDVVEEMWRKQTSATCSGPIIDNALYVSPESSHENYTTVFLNSLLSCTH